MPSPHAPDEHRSGRLFLSDCLSEHDLLYPCYCAVTIVGELPLFDNVAPVFFIGLELAHTIINTILFLSQTNSRVKCMIFTPIFFIYDTKIGACALGIKREGVATVRHHMSGMEYEASISKKISCSSGKMNHIIKH